MSPFLSRIIWHATLSSELQHEKIKHIYRNTRPKEIADAQSLIFIVTRDLGKL